VTGTTTFVTRLFGRANGAAIGIGRGPSVAAHGGESAMTTGRWLAAVAAVVLASGCAATTSGEPVRGGPAGDTTSATTASMTLSSGEATSRTEPEPATDTGVSTASSETSSGATETGVDACPDVSTWTTKDKTVDFAGNAPIREVTADATDCADRFVISIGPDAHDPGYRVRYVDEVVQDGSGELVPLAGAAKLEVIVDSPAYDPGTGRGTLQIPDHDHVVDATGFAVLRQIAFAGSFEGQTTFGIGVSGELPFSVTADVAADGTATLTVAVAHE
jgi:hypothetical protein